MKKISKLAKMKLEVINYHTTDTQSVDGLIINDYFLKSLARDACYTSNKGINYKATSIVAESVKYDAAKKADNVYEIERSERILGNMQLEMSELKFRHTADLEVYKVVTGGETWIQSSPKAIKPAAETQDFSDMIAAARKMVA
tara:strand:+ start:1401 stop:1829 length:429 start_codon:yes stop_codon:yes gene_type:complete